jgi:hypothetical protein
VFPRAPSSSRGRRRSGIWSVVVAGALLLFETSQAGAQPASVQSSETGTSGSPFQGPDERPFKWSPTEPRRPGTVPPPPQSSTIEINQDEGNPVPKSARGQPAPFGEIATPPPEDPSLRPFDWSAKGPRRFGERGPSSIANTSVLSVSGGAAVSPGTAGGWYGRMGLAHIFCDLEESEGVTAGVEYGTEFFSRPGATSYPTIYLVVPIEWWSHGHHVSISLEPGFDALVIDRVAGSFGVGPLTPRATAALSVQAGPVEVGVEANAQYHWLLGANSFGQSLLGVRIQVVTGHETEAEDRMDRNSDWD